MDLVTSSKKSVLSTALNESAMLVDMKKGDELIDSRAYMAGERNKGKEIIDVDSFIIKDMKYMDVDTQGEVIDVDSYENKTVAAKKTKRDIGDVGPSLNGKTIADGHGSKTGKMMLQPKKAPVSSDQLKLAEPSKMEKPEIRPNKAPVPLDEWLPVNMKNKYYVMRVGDDIYDAMLTLTNVADNNNDFYMIQVLSAEANDNDSCMVYNRWGRVGEKGNIMLSGPYSSCHQAIQEFEEKFYEKTRNQWSERKNFVSYPKCHTWLEVDYDKKDGMSPVSRVSKRILDPRVENFIALICDLVKMTKEMTDIGYNAEKLPLKNLSVSTIKKGYEVLKLIADVMDQCEFNRNLFEDLSGEFYTIIPHDFGDKNLYEFIIDTPQKLRSKLEMVDALGGLEEAAKLLRIGAEVKEDALYAQYEHLHCKLVPVEAKSEEFIMIEQYMKNTCADAYTKPNITNIFRVSREGENERFKKYAHIKNRMLLWHGSRLTNWISILQKGLRIAPAEAPLTGSSFGRGIYFADMFAKSAMYSFKASTTSTANTRPATALLLLCEVALGEMQELTCSKSNAHHLPPGKLSTKGMSVTAPSKFEVLEDGVIVPMGQAVSEKKGGLAYNEYVVYNEDQVKLRYVVQVENK